MKSYPAHTGLRVMVLFLVLLSWTGPSDAQSVTLQSATPGAQQIGNYNISGIGLSQVRDVGGQVFNVKARYSGNDGALGNDTGDDAPAIQRAINAAAPTGGIVYLPPGTYRFQSGVTVPGGVTLEGAGWNRTPTDRRGSWIHVAGASTTFTPVTVAGNGAGIVNLAFLHDQPAPGPGWAPASHPFAIVINPSAEVRIRDVLLLNPTYGISVCVRRTPSFPARA